MPWTVKGETPGITEEDLALVAAYYGAHGPCQTLVDMSIHDLRQRSTQVLGPRLHRALCALGIPWGNANLVRHRTQADREHVLHALRVYQEQRRAVRCVLWPLRTQP